MIRRILHRFTRGMRATMDERKDGQPGEITILLRLCAPGDEPGHCFSGQRMVHLDRHSCGHNVQRFDAGLDDRMVERERAFDHFHEAGCSGVPEAFGEIGLLKVGIDENDAQLVQHGRTNREVQDYRAHTHAGL